MFNAMDAVKKAIPEELLELLISQLSSVLDMAIKGEDLTENQKMILKWVYATNLIVFAKWAKDTDSKIDDAFVKEIGEICVDAASEGGFDLLEDFVE